MNYNFYVASEIYRKNKIIDSSSEANFEDTENNTKRLLNVCGRSILSLFIVLMLFSISRAMSAEIEQSKDPLKKTTELNFNLSNWEEDYKMKEKRIKLSPGSGAIGEAGMPVQRTASYLGVFHNFWSNTTNSFTGDKLWYHGAAFGSTFLLAASGADREVQDYFQKDPIGETYGLGALIVGGIWQPVIGGVLYFSSDDETKTAGSAVLQTAMLQFAYTSVLKVITGRPDPIENGDPANKQSGVCGNSSDATAFFKIIRGCTWPSGHSSSAFSLISSLYAFYPEKTWIAYFGYPTAMVIALGMVENDEHWLSDIVAGAFIGHIIGWTIGKNFRKNFDQLNHSQSRRPIQRHFISPVISSTGFGLTYQLKF